MENKDSKDILPKEELKHKIEKAHQVIHDLCKGKREWIMSIPADRERDPDLILNDTLMLLEERVKQLEEEKKRLEEKIHNTIMEYGLKQLSKDQESNSIYLKLVFDNEKLNEENTRLKGLLPDCWESARDYQAFKDHPIGSINPTFEDWCKKNNINL